ncbi:hypothetical protein ACFO3J_24070 [Streptomyces polygonati]|uniref:DUF3618 domain-containing protein n=1 Tax=Streptomyces polygonati TaxID=1617087 RepID=A0ABV8HU81_9ACTN
MTPADPGVYISPAQTHAEVRRVADGQIRMEGKLDEIVRDLRDSRDHLADHESRLRRLEANRWPLPTIGAIAGVGGAVAAVVALLQH